MKKFNLTLLVAVACLSLLAACSTCDKCCKNKEAETVIVEEVQTTEATPANEEVALNEVEENEVLAENTVDMNENTDK
ncbi:MAG: hypothetical protein SZ59_C0002G0005 [candidate division TM6 bacterium GW2011_GWF2_28_16]|nr:MAG: hypothetical protein SZ59_C0002G0005 [candidate division TM6 bacterium GW2011_GWF2_28_16]